MGLSYLNLDPITRSLMATEIAADIADGKLYISDNLSPAGAAAYPMLLAAAAQRSNDDALAAQIRPLLNSHEKPRRLKNGLSKPPAMRCNAHQMLAESEFNRFYIRALCLRAIAAGQTTVEVYRAKAVEEPRDESTAKIGTHVPAQALLDDLRAHVGANTALGLSRPNSGRCVMLS